MFDTDLGTIASQKCEAVRRGLISKAHRLLNHSTLGSRVIKKKKKKDTGYDLLSVLHGGHPVCGRTL